MTKRSITTGILCLLLVIIVNIGLNVGHTKVATTSLSQLTAGTHPNLRSDGQLSVRSQRLLADLQARLALKDLAMGSPTDALMDHSRTLLSV